MNPDLLRIGQYLQFLMLQNLKPLVLELLCGVPGWGLVKSLCPDKFVSESENWGLASGFVGLLERKSVMDLCLKDPATPVLVLGRGSTGGVGATAV